MCCATVVGTSLLNVTEHPLQEHGVPGPCCSFSWRFLPDLDLKVLLQPEKLHLGSSHFGGSAEIGDSIFEMHEIQRNDVEGKI
jgi:hypothetical protein